MAVFNCKVFNPKVFNTDYVAPSVLPRGMRPRRRLFKPLRVRREFVDVLELYSMYLEFQMLIGD